MKPAPAFPPVLAADLALRAAGAALLVVAAATSAILLKRAQLDPAYRSQTMPYLLAALGFLSASVGAGLLCLGRHIHDRIRTSWTWTDCTAQTGLAPPRRNLPGAESS